MPFLHILLLALVQGITEFLPVSSSGHLVLTHYLLGGGSVDLCFTQNRMLDIAVHVGTLFSVLVFYRRDVAALLRGVFAPGTGGAAGGRKLIAYLVLASLPVIAAGFALHAAQPDFLCSLKLMAWMPLIFGIVLWIADRTPREDKTVEAMGWRDALLIGAAQILALLPGTSRSGITMITGRFLGYSRTEAARFSILLALVAISGAGVLTGKDVVESGDFAFGLDIALAVLFSFFAGWAAIALMVKWLERSSFKPFAVYRILLGGGLLVWLYLV